MRPALMLTKAVSLADGNVSAMLRCHSSPAATRSSAPTIRCQP
jgi:hypothetical protein